MGVAPLTRACSRRAFLASVAAAPLAGQVTTDRAASHKGQLLRSDARRYADPSTDFAVVRLTATSYSSYLPAYGCRPVSSRGHFLLFASDRAGKLDAFRMDLKSDDWHQLTDAGNLDAASLALLPGDRAFLYFDGPALKRVSFSRLSERVLYRIPEGFERGRGLDVSDDGLDVVFVEARADRQRLRLLRLGENEPATVVEAREQLADPVFRPRRAGILYRRGGDSLWLVDYAGTGDRRLNLPPGGVGPALWSPDGRTVLFLNYTGEQERRSSIYEVTPDANTGRLVAPTTQFVSFAPNSDASVFAGASASKAAPYVLLLLRATRRELVLCEHRASDPVRVSPMFSPSSQSVIFWSDQHGKPALYLINVQSLVEETGS